MNDEGRGGAWSRDPRTIPWSRRARVLLIWAITVVLAAAAVVGPVPFAPQVSVRLGDVARADITATRQVSYVSEILTKQRQELAASAVPDVFDPPQARVGRQQLALANQLLDFISSVRNDSFADANAKVAYIESNEIVELAPETVTGALALAPSAWERVAVETQAVLERTMRDEIRESTLVDERRRVSSRVSLELPDEDAAIVTEIVQRLLVANSFYNPQRTEERRKAARERVEAVTASLETNEKILRAGDIVTDLDIEALEVLGLSPAATSWEDVRGGSGLVLLLGLLFLYYLWRQEPSFWTANWELLLLPAFMLLFLVTARSAVATHALLPYLYPFAALAMGLTVLFNLRLGLMAAGFFTLVIGWFGSGSLELMTYAFAGSLVGSLKLRRGERLASFAWAGLYIIVANLAVITVFRLAPGRIDLQGLAELSLAAVANGILCVTLTLLGVYLASAVFGIVTPLQLLEISRPTHPLLRQLLLKAPGTYHHTLIVSNMAERAAEAIGADAQLARVGAYYHDVGKAIRPYFFAENRVEGTDPHARLDPYTSAQIIISHVKDGIELARKYRLPHRIIEFIPEHQGTLLVTYFYHEAVKQAGSADKIDQSQFTYPGPKPRSRETAITMLADGAEATVRSRSPSTVEELNETIAQSIQSRVNSGQLDECPLTLADLREIRAAFADVLRGLHHPRVAYPPETRLASEPVRQEELMQLPADPNNPLPVPPDEEYEEEGPIVVRVDEQFAALVDIPSLEAAVAAALQAEGRAGSEMTVVVTTDEAVQELNLQYRQIDCATDVLSFPAQDPAPGFVLPPEAGDYLGDVIVAFPYTQRQAREANRPLAAELQLLAVHGTLHLLGYDHAEPEDERRMWNRQDEILRTVAE